MQVLDEIEAVGGLYRTEHFVYQNFKHGPGYINVDPLFPHLQKIRELGRQMLAPFEGQFDVVCAPATGGIVLAMAVGFAALDQGQLDVLMVFAEKLVLDDGIKLFVFERQSFARLVRGKRVLVVDDIMTNDNPDGSVYKVCRLVEDHGGTVIGVSLVCNRCQGVAANLHVPKLVSMSDINFSAVVHAECMLCYEGVPIVTNVGHGTDFQEKNPDYIGGYKELPF